MIWAAEEDVGARAEDLLGDRLRLHVTPVDARGVLHPESGAGLGGLEAVGKVRLLPGQALQYQGSFTLPTTTGVAAGRFVVVLDEDDPDRAMYDVIVAPMGVSVDGRPVPPIEHDVRSAWLNDAG